MTARHHLLPALALSGQPFRNADLDPAFRFDTQFTDRERQRLVAGDGSFEVRGATRRGARPARLRGP